MGTAMLNISIKTILLAVIHSSKNKTENVHGFTVILIEFRSARWQTIFKFINTVYGRSLIVTSHV